MSDEERQMNWGETPFDNLSKDELLRACQMLFSALGSVETVLRMTMCENPDSLFWANNSVGGATINKAQQALEKFSEGIDKDSIYRQFYRYADDLLFDCFQARIGNKWVICDRCGRTIGAGREMATALRADNPLLGLPCKDSVLGQICHKGDECDCTFRYLTWDDLKTD